MQVRYANMDGLVNLPGPLATCSDLRKVIETAEGYRKELQKNEVVEGLIREKIALNEKLREEVQRAEAELESLETENLVRKVGIGLGLVLAAAALISTSPAAIGSVIALQVISGTGIIALQAMYTDTDTPSLVAGHSKDRVLVFGEPLAEQAGSTGGRLAFRALEAVNLSIEIYRLKEGKAETAQLRQRMAQLLSKANDITEYLDRYGTMRAPWRAMFDTNLQGTITQPKRVIAEHSETDCVVLPSGKPTIHLP